MKHFTKKLLLLGLCLCLVLPAMSCITSITAFAAESSDANTSEVDIWETLGPAYMNTAFRSITDRMKGNGTIAAMQLYCIIDGVAFYGDPLTGEMVLLTLADASLKAEDVPEGEIPEYVAYYSTNPYNVGSSQSAEGTQSSASVKEELYAQLVINYTENNNDLEMNSYSDAAVNDQITVKMIRGGVRVEYTIGREQVNYLVPRLIRMEKLDALIQQVSENSESLRDSRTLAAFFTKKDLSDETQTAKGLAEIEATYPITKQFAVYVCEPHITRQELMRVERLIKDFTNYDYDQLEADHAETNYENTDDAPALFKLAIEYKVDEDGGFTVRCNAGNIRFDSSVYKLSNVTLLPFAGAGDVNNNTGYIFTPDGSGSLISFQDIRGLTFVTTNKLYGQDYAFHTISGSNKEIMRLPVFGVYEEVAGNKIKQVEKPVLDDNGEPTFDEDGNPITEMVEEKTSLKIGYLAVIESGDSLADITVENGGSKHMFASVYTAFNPRPKDTYILDGGISAGSNSTWTVESKRKYTGDYKLRIFTLDELDTEEDSTPEAAYSEMAREYRKYLISKGVLTELQDTTEDIPLYLETLGSVRTMTKILGIPVSTKVPLTTFQQMIDIIDDFKNVEDNPITNIKLKLSGWANDGMIPEVPNKVKIEDCLGGEEGFKKLVAYAKENGVTLFPDLDYTLAYQDRWFDGFTADDDLAETIDERNSIMKEYDPVWQGFIRNGVGIISASKMSGFYDKMYNDYKKYDIGAISVGTLGEYLSSDFNSEDPLNREDSKTLVRKLLSKIQEQNAKVLINGGNAYALQYATDIIEVPLDDSAYKYAGATIPFMGMVLHGYKEYTGIALNLAGDYRYTILKTIENGASPYFVVADSNTSELKQYSGYSTISQYYSIRYTIWFKDIVEAYTLLNDALKDVKYSNIVAHRFLDANNKVVRVEYDNGTVFYINYLLNEFTYKNGETEITIPAEGFVKTDAQGKILITD